MKIDEKYTISGMSCAACSARINKTVSSLSGIKEVNVNLLTNSMVVTYDDTLLSSSKIIETIEKIGYGATLLDISSSTTSISKKELEDHETPKLIKRLIISFILLIPLFYLSMGFMLGWPIGFSHEYLWLLALIEMLLSLSIILINIKFFISGTKAILHKTPNMDTLVMLGSGVAFIYSFIIMCFLFNYSINGYPMEKIHMTMMNISFETSGMVPTLITIGKTLESFSKGKTTNAIKALLDLSPKTATLLINNEEKVVSVEEVKINDIFIIKPGESVPVDAEVIKGISSIDESMLTGESLPIDKTIGSIVKSGTINQNGVLICKAIRVGKETTLNQIIASVEKAANSKARISRIADKVSGIFVPVVIIIALIVFLCWLLFGADFVNNHLDIQSSLLSYSIERGIAVLVISCPCALGLATPVAIMVGNGKGAKNGILFKNAEAIENTGKIKYIVLDKTGTITEGKPTVVDIIPTGDINELLQIAFSLEVNSSHPLSKAITHYCNDKNIKSIEVTNFENITGKGIQGRINSEFAIAGNVSFMKIHKIDISKYESQIENLSKQGKTPILFAKGKDFLGIIAVSDVIKSDSKESIAMIKKLGIIPIMLTGDNANAANHIASQVGIDYVISEVLPEGKLQVIEKLKTEGKVLMVGDGINDSIALTSADVGMAIGQGNDIAIDSADIVLMKSSLKEAYAAIRLSQYTYLNIKENLFWAFFYNLIMIPIAAGAFSGIGLYKLAPWMGSAAMAASSVFVVLNALRINFFNPYKKKLKGQKTKIPNFLLNINSCPINKEELNMKKLTLNIDGMMCMHCVAHVKKALESIEGVQDVEVSLEKNEATLKADENIQNDIFYKAIEEAGYKINSIK